MSLSFQVEKWSDALDELRPMFAELWADVAIDKDRFRAKCDEDKYAALEKLNMLCVVTARSEGVLVGYYVALITPNPHYFGQGLMALTDMYYLSSEFRKGTNGLQLFAFAEKTWRELGCVKCYTSHKIHRDRSKMLSVLGFVASDIIYSKVLV